MSFVGTRATTLNNEPVGDPCACLSDALYPPFPSGEGEGGRNGFPVTELLSSVTTALLAESVPCCETSENIKYFVKFRVNFVISSSQRCDTSSQLFKD